MTGDLFQAAPLPVAPLGEEERLACLRLIRSENVGPVTFRQLVNRFGGATEALEALPDLARRGGARRTIRICPRELGERELAAAEAIAARPVFTIEPGFPRPLASLDHPPPMIYVTGRSELLNQPTIAMVGSRNCSAAGHALTRRIAHELGEAGFVIASGLARGIDGAAHEAAVETGTIAVLAGGIDNIYPPEHADLHARIGLAGCLVSEQPPGFRPRGKDFPRRNRIISGISYGVVVVEAASRSGTLTTARFANEQGREVFAVPGHPLDPRAEGTNRLIKSGATMITSAHDVLDVIRPMLEMPAPPSRPDDFVGGNESGDTVPDDMTLQSDADLDQSARDAVARALGPAPVHIDDLLRATGLDAQNVQIALLELSLAGRLDHHGAHLVSLREGK